jgi:hypothetical protein
MKWIGLLLTFAVIGVLLIALSFLWPCLVRTDMVWGDPQAREHARAAAELHQLAHERAHATESNHRHDAESLAAARRRYERSQAELQAARSFRRRPTTLLRWAGVVCCLAGGVGYWVLRAAAD